MKGRRLITALLATGLTLSFLPLAADEDGDASLLLKERIQEAQSKLNEAARTLAELHGKQVLHGDERKLMLGVLLAGPGEDKGLKLAGVTPSGGAEEAGLQAGDTLTAIDGVRLDMGKPLNALRGVLKEISLGDSVNLEYLRDGGTYFADLIPQERVKHMIKIISGELGDMNMDFDFDMSGLEALGELGNELGHELGKMQRVIKMELGGHRGLELRAIDGSLAKYFDVDEGVLVLSVGEELGDLTAGDVLLSVAGQEVATAREARKAMAGAEGEAEVQVIRKGKNRSFTIDLSDYGQLSSMMHRLHEKIEIAGDDVRVIRIEDGVVTDDSGK